MSDRISDTARDSAEHPRRLDEIPTRWSLLRLAHPNLPAVTPAEIDQARRVLVLRYARAIRNYVGVLVRHTADADEIAQEVVVRLLRGQFASASPERGSFRRMLMAAAHNLVKSFWSRQQRSPRNEIDLTGIPGSLDEDALEAEGIAQWRQALLELAWKALEEYQQTHPGSVAHTILHLRTTYPDDTSEQLADRLSRATGKLVRAPAARQQLRRARVRFAQALLEEVARGLDDPSPIRVEEELRDTGLMPYLEDLLPEDWLTTGYLLEE